MTRHKTRPLSPADALRDHIKKSGHTQSVFCEKHNIANSTLHRLLTGDAAVTPGMNEKIRKATRNKINWNELRLAWIAGEFPVTVTKITTKRRNNGRVKQTSPEPRHTETIVPPEEAGIEVARMYSHDPLKASVEHYLDRQKILQHGLEAFHSKVAVETKLPEPAADFQDYVNNAVHRPRNLIVFVTQLPKGMREDERRMMETLVELHVNRIEGFLTGHEVVDTGSEYTLKQAAHSPAVSIVERYGKLVHGVLASFVQDYVVSRPKSYQLHDGMNWLVIEPDPTLTKVQEAWHLIGVVPGNTGLLESSRQLDKAHDSQVQYWIPLLTTLISSNDEVKAAGQTLLDGINSSASGITVTRNTFEPKS